MNQTLSLTVLELFSLVSSIVSTLLRVYAIWLSWEFKKESDRVNENTRALLIDIKTDAKSIAHVSSSELSKYGDMSRQVIAFFASMQSKGTEPTLASPPMPYTGQVADSSTAQLREVTAGGSAQNAGPEGDGRDVER